jgi:hypothetical protein
MSLTRPCMAPVSSKSFCRIGRMIRTAVLIALAGVLLSGALGAQAGTQATTENSTACPSTATLDDLVKALDEAVSGPANKDRTCLRQVMFPDARLTPVGKAPDGSFGPHILTVDGWIDAVAKRGSDAFYERQVKVDKQQYGHIANLWCAYEIRPTPDGKATVHGVNSIQAVYDGTRWRVLAVLWEAETTARTAPENKTP